MGLKCISAKTERKVKRTIYVSIGLIGILFIAAILLTILPLNSSIASASSGVDGNASGTAMRSPHRRLTRL